MKVVKFKSPNLKKVMDKKKMNRKQKKINSTSSGNIRIFKFMNGCKEQLESKLMRVRKTLLMKKAIMITTSGTINT